MNPANTANCAWCGKAIPERPRREDHWDLEFWDLKLRLCDGDCYDKAVERIEAIEDDYWNDVAPHEEAIHQAALKRGRVLKSLEEECLTKSGTTKPNTRNHCNYCGKSKVLEGKWVGAEELCTCCNVQ
jgi:hypothetical protein